jgi:hypothetical protein
MVNPYRFYTYAYLREDRTPYYIGKGTNKRLYVRGKTDIKPPKDKYRIIYLKQNLTEEEAFKHETYMIAVFGRKDLGTGILHNRTNGGDGSSGVVVSEETKLKMSKTRKGKSFSGEHKRKISEAKKQQTEETRKKISQANRGKKRSEEQRKLMSERVKGRKHSEETKKKMSEKRKGRVFSEEHKQKIREALSGIKRSEETKKKISEASKGRTPWNKGVSMGKLPL